MSARPIVVLCPHFAPDTAPTGEIFTTIVAQMAAQGRRVHVVTALPWYANHSIEDGWTGRPVRRERTSWGSVIRVHPFPGGDKRNLPRRALGFVLFSAVAGVCTLFAGGWRRRPAAVISMSPPLTLGLTGWLASRLRGARAVFNIQDVFPDAAVSTGAITNRHVIRAARFLERVTYRRSDSVVVLSDDLRRNVVAKIGERHAHKVTVIPNFVDAGFIVPAPRDTQLRRELGIGDEPVVMYAGNVGFSQSLDLVIAAARRIPGATFVINGDGSERARLEASAAGVTNMRFSGYQPRERVPEVLATGDVHVVPLRAGLAAVSVPSKTYSILAAGRPVIAAIDEDTEIPRLLASSGAGVSVPPDDEERFVRAIEDMLSDPGAMTRMGTNGRGWVEEHVSPAAVAGEYLKLADRRR
jgi:colanic acid biosynthesis glycosyl transferase WcaI